MTDRERRDGRRRQEIQRGGGQEGDAQHLHGARAQLRRGGGQGLGLRLLPAEQHQGGQAAHAVEEPAREAAERVELAAAGLRRTDAGQRHRDGHQDSCDEQDHAAGHVHREGGGADHQRPGDGECRRRQPAGQEAFQRLDPVHDQRGAFADGALVGGAFGQQPVEDRRAEPGLSRFPRRHQRAFLRDAEPGREQGQRSRRTQLRPARRAEAEKGGDQGCDEPSLGDAGGDLRHAERKRQRQPRAGRLRFAPEKLLRSAVHSCRSP